MLVHQRVAPSIPIHTPGWRGTVRVKYLAQKHNAMSLARAQTQSTQSEVKCTTHPERDPGV